MLDEYIKYLFAENLLVTIIVIFIILYIYFNMNMINDGNYLGGLLSKPIVYTCIIILIGLLLLEFNNKCGNNKDNNVDNKAEYEKTYKIVKNKDIFINQGGDIERLFNEIKYNQCLRIFKENIINFDINLEDIENSLEIFKKKCENNKIILNMYL